MTKSIAWLICNLIVKWVANESISLVVFSFDLFPFNVKSICIFRFHFLFTFVIHSVSPFPITPVFMPFLPTFHTFTSSLLNSTALLLSPYVCFSLAVCRPTRVHNSPIHTKHYRIIIQAGINAHKWYISVHTIHTSAHAPIIIMVFKWYSA